MADTTPRFDPRFDAAFQRGFDGEAPVAVASESALSSRAKAPAAPTAPQPSAQPIAESPASAALAEESAASDDEPEPVGRRANPFLIALGIVAIALIAFGLFLFQTTRAMFLESQTSSNFDYITLQTVMYAAPIATALGVATGIGVLFVYAIRYGQRPTA